MLSSDLLFGLPDLGRAAHIFPSLFPAEHGVIPRCHSRPGSIDNDIASRLAGIAFPQVECPSTQPRRKGPSHASPVREVGYSAQKSVRLYRLLRRMKRVGRQEIETFSELWWLFMIEWDSNGATKCTTHG